MNRVDLARRAGKRLWAMATGAATVALVGAVVVVTHASAPPTTIDRLPHALPLPHTEAVLVCQGGISRTIDTGVTATQIAEKLGGWAGAYSTTPAQLDATPIAANTVLSAAALTKNDAGMTQLTGDIVVNDSGVAAGASIHSAVAGDMRGVAVRPCQWPSNSVWLVGGSTKVGSSMQLSISNPMATAINIEMTAYANTGLLDLGGHSHITLAPKTTQTLLLDGVLPPADDIALHLTSNSGRFAASVQTMQLVGAQPAGIDVVTAGTFGRDLVIPGLVVPGVEQSATNRSYLADPNFSAYVRVVNPNATPAQISVIVIDTTGEHPLPGAEGISVSANSVLKLSLAGISPGDYALKITSDSDISAGVTASQAGDGGVDVAYLHAVTPVSDGMATVGPTQAVLVLAGMGSATWQAFDEAGTQIGKEAIELAHVEEVKLPQETKYVRVTANSPVYGAAMLSGPSGISWVPVNQDAAQSRSVRLTVAP
ncbi:DUF5719 family protein [Trueperella sp. LYQ141]|uniref:DUF5719 family protein n=1 Tax=Trueperella sp. LYQ141 TaxID=3391058 RepID=UPI00398330A8